MAHSSWLWLAPKPATGSAMVLSATLRTVLSSTIAIRLVIRTPRMIHRRRYTFGSVSASGATAEAPACGEAPGESMAPFPDPRLADAVAPRPVLPGTVTGRPGKTIDTEQYRIAKHSRRTTRPGPGTRVPAATRGTIPRPGRVAF